MMIKSLAPALSLLGAGAYCDASYTLLKNFLLLCVQVNPRYHNRGMPWQRGQSPRERQSILNEFP